MLNTGLRSGEALALRNDDFDFEAHTVRIERNAVQVKKRDRHSRAQGGYDLRIQTPKTRTRRDTIKCGRDTNGSRGAWRRLCVFLTENTLAFADPHTKIKDHRMVAFYFGRGTNGSGVA